MLNQDLNENVTKVEEQQMTIWEKERTIFKHAENKYRFADLFAGCGGLGLGLIQAGFSCEFVNEINETFVETHKYNHNINEDRYFIGDINKLLPKLYNYQAFIGIFHK